MIHGWTNFPDTTRVKASRKERISEPWSPVRMHSPLLTKAHSDLEQRRPVWLAFSDLFLDTDVNLWRRENTRLLAASAYSLAELDAILREEVYPACSFNLSLVAGEWAGFDSDWLEQRILCGGGPRPQSWWRRLHRYLLLGWRLPMRLPEEWPGWREDIVQLRASIALHTVASKDGSRHERE